SIFVGNMSCNCTRKEKRFLFTSESVTEGHSDKMCDQISNAVLDAYIKVDPDARVACESQLDTKVKLEDVDVISRTLKQLGTIRKAERKRIEAFELWCWRRLLRVSWTARRSNRSVLEEINPDCSLEGQIVKMKLKYFGHLTRRKDSLEKSLMLGTIDGKRRRGRQRMRWLDGVTEAVECVAKTGMILLCGEITSKAVIDYQQVVRDTIKRIGYDDSSKGLDYKTCTVLVALEQQCEEIKQAISCGTHDEDVAAGDQGLMFGYATDETDECMPTTILLAHKISAKIKSLASNGTLPWIRPDGKTQVGKEQELSLDEHSCDPEKSDTCLCPTGIIRTLDWSNGRHVITMEYRDSGGALEPLRVHTLVISVQHAPGVPLAQIQRELMGRVVKEVIPAKYLDENTIYHLLPSKAFVEGGPKGDAGLTGRKIIVDTYGGWGAHGGGAFSGKDPSKVDRSGAYAARWVAKSLVKAGLCRRVLVQLSYSIGLSHPLAISVFHYGTSDRSEDELLDIIQKNFDLRVGSIIRPWVLKLRPVGQIRPVPLELNLKRPIYQQTACYGHFGREEFTWEKPKQLVY
ncbi:S-adenosylmethionine synthase isoform type-2, partial [Varanus komodoensis]